MGFISSVGIRSFSVNEMCWNWTVHNSTDTALFLPSLLNDMWTKPCVINRHIPRHSLQIVFLLGSVKQLQRDVTPLTTAISPRDIQFIKCNGNVSKIRKDNACTYQQEYLSQIVVLGKWLALNSIFSLEWVNGVCVCKCCVRTKAMNVTVGRERLIWPRR